MIMFMDDKVKDKNGRIGVIVPIPNDCSFASKDDPFTMARLVYVKFGDEDAILVPESRLKEIHDEDGL